MMIVPYFLAELNFHLGLKGARRDKKATEKRLNGVPI